MGDDVIAEDGRYQAESTRSAASGGGSRIEAPFQTSYFLQAMCKNLDPMFFSLITDFLGTFANFSAFSSFCNISTFKYGSFRSIVAIFVSEHNDTLFYFQLFGIFVDTLAISSGSLDSKVTS